MAHIDENGNTISDLSIRQWDDILDQWLKNFRQDRLRRELREFKGTPIDPSFAKNEIDRYIRLGVSKSDIACLAASWGLSTNDLETANEYIHEVVVKRDRNGRFAKKDEGIII